MNFRLVSCALFALLGSLVFLLLGSMAPGVEAGKKRHQSTTVIAVSNGRGPTNVVLTGGKKSNGKRKPYENIIINTGRR